MEVLNLKLWSNIKEITEKVINKIFIYTITLWAQWLNLIRPDYKEGKNNDKI